MCSVFTVNGAALLIDAVLQHPRAAGHRARGDQGDHRPSLQLCTMPGSVPSQTCPPPWAAPKPEPDGQRSPYLSHGASHQWQALAATTAIESLSRRSKPPEPGSPSVGPANWSRVRSRSICARESSNSAIPKQGHDRMLAASAHPTANRRVKKDSMHAIAKRKAPAVAAYMSAERCVTGSPPYSPSNNRPKATAVAPYMNEARIFCLILSRSIARKPSCV